MAKPYFRYIPDFEYVDRTSSGQKISDYTEVKNLFKRAKIRDDILNNLGFFTKYQVVGDDRPDNVAEKVYGDSNLDWLVMLCNNIIHFEDEWPMAQESFNNYLINKYGSYENAYATKHYVTSQVKDSQNTIIVPQGVIVPSDYSVTFYDQGLNQTITRSGAYPVSNYEYEVSVQNKKRNIFVIKPFYLALIIDDLEAVMPYGKGSSQYVSPSLVRGENIRLFQ